MSEELDLAHIETMAKKYLGGDEVVRVCASTVLGSLEILRTTEQQLPPGTKGRDKIIMGAKAHLRRDWQNLRKAIRHG